MAELVRTNDHGLLSVVGGLLAEAELGEWPIGRFQSGASLARIARGSPATTRS